MPAKSQAQQKAAGAALAAKRGEIPRSSLKGASREMADSMTESELEDMASTKRKGKPQHAAKRRSSSGSVPGGRGALFSSARTRAARRARP